MDIGLRGKTALVTGAGSGIGAAAARGLGAAGAHVFIHFNRSSEGAASVKRAVEESGGTAETLQADLTDSRAAAALVEKVLGAAGSLDILVNNAGDLVRRAKVAELSDEEFRKTLDVNLTSIFAVSRAALPSMTRQHSGSIINLTSVAARNGGGGGSVIYAASKGAVSTFTRGLAKEVAADGIRVNAVAPGIITTPFHDRHTEGALMERMLTGVPMGRAGTPEECVGAILFLASDVMSGYVTGQVLEVNGGQLMP